MLATELPAAAASDVKLSGRRRALRGGVWVVAGRLIGLGLVFLVHFLLARVLTPADFGLFALVFNTIGFCSILARFGVDRTMIRYIAESLGVGDPQRARQALRMGWRLAAVSVLGSALVLLLVLAAFGDSFLAPTSRPALVAALVAGLTLLAFMHVAAESLRGLGRLGLASLFDARPNGPLINLAFLALVAAAGLMGNVTLLVVLGAYVAALAGSLAAAGWYLWRATDRLPSRSVESASPVAAEPLRYAELLSFCVPMCLGQLAGFLSGNADVWIAGATVSAGQLALFAAARHLTSVVAVPVYMANLATISLIPELHAQGRRKELEDVLRSAATAATALSIVVLAVIAIWPREILSLAFGDFYEDAALVLLILSAGHFVVCWTGGCQTCLAMAGRHKAQLAVAVAAAIAQFTLGAYAAVQWGIVGLAAASSSILAASNIIQWLMARRLVGVWTHAGLFGWGAMWALVKRKRGRRLASVESDEPSAPNVGRIFVVGCPRSGTTLVQSMVSAHSQVISFTESHLFDKGFYSLGGWSVVRPKQLLEYADKFVQENGHVVGATEPHWPAGAGRRSAAAVARQIVATLDRAAQDCGAAYWVEKTPDHVFRIPLIRSVAPHARFIHVIRRADAVLPSLFTASRQWGRTKSWFSCAMHWTCALLKSAQFAHGENHYVVAYEELVENRRAVFQALLAWLGLPWEESVLEDVSRASARCVAPGEVWKQNNLRDAAPFPRASSARVPWLARIITLLGPYRSLRRRSSHG